VFVFGKEIGMAERLKVRKLVEDVARVADGDYPTGFKMLGFVLYVSEHGAEDLLSGAMVSPRTYYRWVDTVRAAGWDSVLADVRFKQALREYVTGLEGRSVEARNVVLGKLNEVLAGESVGATADLLEEDDTRGA
jgi:hypothetical protein